MSPKDRPPIRACLFDMDGLLLDTEDLYTVCTNEVLHEYGKPDMPWSIKAKLQGRPGPEASRIFFDWAQLPITQDEYQEKQRVLQRKHFPRAAPLPGIPELLSTLATAHTRTTTPPRPIALALATSAHHATFELKTAHLAALFDPFPDAHRVLGDDPRVEGGRGKPLPDIYLRALACVNDGLAAARSRGESDAPDVRPGECLVFEDSVPGVEAGRRAGMQVVWCPHAGLRREFAGREEEVLAGVTGAHEGVGEAEERDGLVGTVGDGWGVLVESMEGFPYERFGIEVQGK